MMMMMKHSGKNQHESHEDEEKKKKMKSSTLILLSGSPTTVTLSHEDADEIPPPMVLPETMPTTTTTTTTTTTAWKILPASNKSLRTTNPIRAIVDPIVASIQSGNDRGDGKDHISLALGDPTAAGNLPPCPAALLAIRQTLNSHTSHAAAGYVNACGLPEARQAIAAHHLASSMDHVIVANGCSGALELALTALLDSNNTNDTDNDDSILLVPQPGFPLYQVIAESHGAKVVHYRLREDCHWECDLDHLQELCAEYGSSIRAIVINNPSNPTGAVFSWNHLQDIVCFCNEHQLPIVADEVYGDLTFGGKDNAFHPMAKVAASLGMRVPVITASGIGKQYLLPGWRVGWIVFHDNIYGSLREVEAGAKRLAQVILGASHLAQTAVPALLNKNDASIPIWKAQLCATLELQANLLCQKLATIPGLTVLPAGGAMYTMVRIDIDQFDGAKIANDVDFCKLLLQEENVFCLPGTCFGLPNVFRVVFCAPVSVLEEATHRIAEFCQRHHHSSSSTLINKK